MEEKQEKIKIKDLRGSMFKKRLFLNRCRFGYHNKNNSGGNFGLDFYRGKEFNPKTDFSLSGNYNINGEICRLSISSIRIGEFGFKINLEECGDIDDLIKIIRDFYKSLILESL